MTKYSQKEKVKMCVRRIFTMRLMSYQLSLGKQHGVMGVLTLTQNQNASGTFCVGFLVRFFQDRMRIFSLKFI
jgi:hypothetical protein